MDTRAHVRVIRVGLVIRGWKWGNGWLAYLAELPDAAIDPQWVRGDAGDPVTRLA